MSAIDTLRHELCGTLAGLPVYFVLDDSPHQDLEVPTSNRLLVGGGSGEHPAASFDIVACVYHLLLEDELEEVDPHAGPRLFGFPYERIEALLEVIGPVVPDLEDSFSFSWGGDDWYSFVERARRQEGYGTPYDQSRHSSIEMWMAASLGEYALVSMPSRVVSLLPGSVSEEVLEISKAVAHRPLYLNVMSFPTGYETVGGRRERLADGNVRH